MSDRAWRIASYAAVATTALALCVQLLLPKPDLVKIYSKGSRDKTSLEIEIEKLRDDVSAQKAKNLARLWVEPADQVAAKAMQRVTELAKSNDLKLLSFRPQRVDEAGGVARHPYQISIEGYFPKLMAFVRALETPKLKLPVITVQVASADGASDRVTATVGIVAFRELIATKP